MGAFDWLTKKVGNFANNVANDLEASRNTKGTFMNILGGDRGGNKMNGASVLGSFLNKKITEKAKEAVDNLKNSSGDSINDAIANAIQAKRKGGKVKNAKSYKGGGLVRSKPVHSKFVNMKFNTADLKGDTVPAVLTAGEIVIPLNKVKRVSKLLKKNHIKLPNM